MIIEYFLTYCDYGEGQVNVEIVGPMMTTRKYDTFKNQIKKSGAAELIDLCSILDFGKSLLNGKPFITNEDNNAIGLWTTEEQHRLLNKLGDLKKKTFDTEGLEYVISDLEETKDRNKELIIDIEK